MHTLLIINDDPDVLTSLRRGFRKNYRVLLEESGGSARLKEHANQRA